MVEENIKFGGNNVFHIVNEHNNYSSSFVRYGDELNILEIEVYDFLGRIKTIDCALAGDLVERTIKFPSNDGLKEVNQPMFFDKPLAKRNRPFKMVFNRNEMDIIFSRNTNIKSYYKDSRLEYYYDKNDHLCYIRVKDLSLDEYEFLKREKMYPGQYMKETNENYDESEKTIGGSMKNEEVYYFDKDGNPVENQKDAEKAIIRELDENGNLINETFGFFNEKKGPVEITRDELEKAKAMGFDTDKSDYVIVDDNNLSR